jgi:hypothetical protein
LCILIAGSADRTLHWAADGDAAAVIIMKYD